MNHGSFTRRGVLLVVALAVALLAELPSGQAPPGPPGDKENWTPARTPWGDPDLQGTWTNTTTTPLERPKALAGKTTLTAEERAARDALVAGAVEQKPKPGDTGAYNSFWME